MKPADARSASFNPQHAAYNPTSSMSTPRPQEALDARAAAYNPQHRAFNPTSQK